MRRAFSSLKIARSRIWHPRPGLISRLLVIIPWFVWRTNHVSPWRDGSMDGERTFLDRSPDYLKFSFWMQNFRDLRGGEWWRPMHISFVMHEMLWSCLVRVWHLRATYNMFTTDRFDCAVRHCYVTRKNVKKVKNRRLTVRLFTKNEIWQVISAKRTSDWLDLPNKFLTGGRLPLTICHAGIYQKLCLTTTFSWYEICRSCFSRNCYLPGYFCLSAIWLGY